VGLHIANIRKHPVLLNCFQRGVHRSHRNHAAAKRGPEIILFDTCGDLVGNQTGAHRNTAAQSLRQSDDVRNNLSSRFAAGKEPITGSTYSGLYFIVDKDDATFVAQLAERSEEVGCGSPNAGH